MTNYNLGHDDLPCRYSRARPPAEIPAKRLSRQASDDDTSEPLPMQVFTLVSNARARLDGGGVAM